MSSDEERRRGFDVGYAVGHTAGLFLAAAAGIVLLSLVVGFAASGVAGWFGVNVPVGPAAAGASALIVLASEMFRGKPPKGLAGSVVGFLTDLLAWAFILGCGIASMVAYSEQVEDEVLVVEVLLGLLGAFAGVVVWAAAVAAWKTWVVRPAPVSEPDWENLQVRYDLANEQVQAMRSDYVKLHKARPEKVAAPAGRQRERPHGKALPPVQDKPPAPPPPD